MKAATVGGLLREWRERRRLSQFELAGEVEISTRHLSFLETGRSQPSREMLLRLAEHLNVPLRERNVLLIAAGLAPAFGAHSLSEPTLERARCAVEMVLRAQEPFPALALDRYWNMVASNRAVAPLLDGVDPSLLQAPVNVLRLSLHPLGLAPRIVNLSEWRGHLLERLRRQIDLCADPVLIQLFDELRQYPGGKNAQSVSDYAGIIVPLQLRTEAGVLSFFSTTTIFGTALDITLSELVLESFFPTDEFTTRAMLAGQKQTVGEVQ
ncbi:XRE family transcriptional regulator [bacterium]|nr:MAG: XRE family transcriptional regulator [bacterium]